MARLNLVVINTGKVPTFRRGNSVSYIDVTCGTQNTTRMIKEWKVLQTENLTDHAYIFCEVTNGGTGTSSYKSQSKKGSFCCDWHAFINELDLRTATMTATDKTSYQLCTKALREAYRNNTYRLSSDSAPYWWNNEIHKKRRECTAARRLLTRNAGNPKIPRECTATRRLLTRNAGNPKIPDNVKAEIESRYRAKKKEFCKQIRAAKRKCWSDLCGKLEEDVCGSAYKIAIRDMKSYPAYDIDSKDAHNRRALCSKKRRWL
ncbi:hypothetical protein QE152_g36179 [Popillia japonica]|uniref:Endonuclease/exonuclease/phosphatase domain-containing protein n=1 Tax=Popillia japonica TaxID=7064 RepID=A0AAW1IDX2_POPJA